MRWTTGSGLWDKADGTVVFPVDERVGMLPEILQDQVTLSHRTAGNQLDRIDAAGIVLDNTDKIFIIRTAGPEGVHCVLCRPVTECKPGAGVPVECNGFIDRILWIVS